MVLVIDFDTQRDLVVTHGLGLDVDLDCKISYATPSTQPRTVWEGCRGTTRTATCSSERKRYSIYILGHRSYEDITETAPAMYDLFKKEYSEVGPGGFNDIRAKMEDSLGPFTTGKLEGGVLV